MVMDASPQTANSKDLFTLEIDAPVAINDLEKFVHCFVNKNLDLQQLDILS
jgi:hypothetical protein